MNAAFGQASKIMSSVEWRLDEAFQAFEIHRLLNDRCGPDASPELHAIVEQSAGFWQAVNLGLQTTLIICIAAVLERRTDCATFYSAMSALPEGASRGLPPVLREGLDRIQKSYVIYRHKLFAHNDQRRDDMVIKMQDAGFTWESVAADLQHLNRSHKHLRHICAEVSAPSWEELDSRLYMHDLAAVRARQHTNLLLDVLLRGLGPLAQEAR